MLLFRAILFEFLWNLAALSFLFYSWGQCSANSHVREVQAAVMGSVTITFHYDTYRYKNLASSWCRQMSMTACDTIVHTLYNKSISDERVTISQITNQSGTVKVTMIKLQHWDTGLYMWRVWTGENYTVIESVLLQVVIGLPLSLHIARYTVHDRAEIHCEHILNDKQSKIWYKKTSQKNREWVAHSLGAQAPDYKSRTLVVKNKEGSKLTILFTLLELWDSGTYQCELNNKTVLTEVLLIVTTGKEMFSKTQMPSVSSSYQNTKQSSHLLPDNSNRDYISSAEGNSQPSELNTQLPTMTTQFRAPNNSDNTVQLKNRHNNAWDILRWILFLTMLLCALLSAAIEGCQKTFLLYIGSTTI